MKKIAALAIIIALAITLMSCGEKTPVDKDVDLDLTSLTSVLVYSEVYNMLVTPENYIGKTVKMSGQFTTAYGEDTGLYYPAVIIKDATACCSQGMEFVLKGNPKYPSGYPELNKEITVVGTFETYDENGYLFCHLVDAEIVG